MLRRIAGRGGAVAALIAVAIAAAANPAGAVILVDTVDDQDVDDTSCSLREAIVTANINASYHGCLSGGAGHDTIAFNLGSGTPVINVGASRLPAITQQITIDGGAERVELHGPGGMLVSGQNGLTIAQGAAGSVIRNLVINNFADDGIYIDADQVTVVGCLIGTDAGGGEAVPNRGFGIQVFGGASVHIGGATSGGSCSGDCNLISGAVASKANLFLDVNSSNASVRGNFIGTDIEGAGPITITSRAPGIIDKGRDNQIGGISGVTPGGPCTGDCNLISGNGLDGGIFIEQGVRNTIIRGNFIGTDVTGTQRIGNGGVAIDELRSFGIFARGSGLQIGGTTPEARNVVSGNYTAQIFVQFGSANIQGNYLGTNAAGTASIPDSGNGVDLYNANHTMIGASSPGSGNVISGNFGYGVRIVQTSFASVLGNIIGPAADGVAPIFNSIGVQIEDFSTDNVIGDGNTGGNIIAFSYLQGVVVDGQSPPVHNNAIRGNSIHSNETEGIALFANANDSIAPPVILGIQPLHGTACFPCQVEIFSDSEDEGRLYEGAVFNSDGNWSFSGTLTGPNVTVTSTDMSGNTSAFSLPVSLNVKPTATATSSPTELAPTATPTLPPTVVAPTATSTPPATEVVPTATATARPTKTPAVCVGDCDEGFTVTVDEVITLVNIALGTLSPETCVDGLPGDEVDVALIIQAVTRALFGCDESQIP